MTTYFQEGGWSMILILCVAMVAAGVAVVRKGKARSGALWVGSYACLMSGVLGMATGMLAVSSQIGRFADKGAAVAQGLGELSNNGTFSVGLATLLGIAALLTRPKSETA